MGVDLSSCTLGTTCFCGFRSTTPAMRASCTACAASGASSPPASSARTPTCSTPRTPTLTRRARVVVTAGLLFVTINATIGMRVPEEVEDEGLDSSEHGLVAYGGGKSITVKSKGNSALNEVADDEE